MVTCIQADTVKLSHKKTLRHGNMETRINRDTEKTKH
jgi:hypothetical protein